MRLFPLFFCLSLSAFAQDEPPAGGGRGGGGSERAHQRDHVSGLRARNIGPAFVSGRVSQIAMFPDSFQPLPDRRSLRRRLADPQQRHHLDSGLRQLRLLLHRLLSTIDPKNPSIVWVGTGENNNQRSVSYGDGVYKSEDGGRTWRNMGLKKTEHIARIMVDPRDSNVVYVAAPGPLWKGGGERGLYKTTDGGKTWSQSLIKVGDYTGCSDLVMDPQESRHPAGGHPSAASPLFRHDPRRSGERAVWRSIDAGKTWTQVRGGFPQGDLGRIGLNYAPSQPNIIYAQVEGPKGAADCTVRTTTA